MRPRPPPADQRRVEVLARLAFDAQLVGATERAQDRHDLIHELWPDATCPICTH